MQTEPPTSWCSDAKPEPAGIALRNAGRSQILPTLPTSDHFFRSGKKRFEDHWRAECGSVAKDAGSRRNRTLITVRGPDKRVFQSFYLCPIPPRSPILVSLFTQPRDRSHIVHTWLPDRTARRETSRSPKRSETPKTCQNDLRRLSRFQMQRSKSWNDTQVSRPMKSFLTPRAW